MRSSGIRTRLFFLNGKETQAKAMVLQERLPLIFFMGHRATQDILDLKHSSDDWNIPLERYDDHKTI
jgi:hypothetical protein